MKPKGKYIHPDTNYIVRDEVRHARQLGKSGMEAAMLTPAKSNKQVMRAFLRGKR